MDSYNIFSTRTTLESIAPITSQDSFTPSVKTPETFQATMPRKRDKSQESFYSLSGNKPMESFQQTMPTKSSTLSRHHVKTIEVPRVPDTYSKTLYRSKSKDGHYEPFMFRTQQSPSEPRIPIAEKSDMLPDLSEAGYMITEL